MRKRKQKQPQPEVAKDDSVSVDNYEHCKYFYPLMVRMKGMKKAKYCESIGYPKQGEFIRVLFAGDNYSTYIEHKDLIEVKDAA